MIAPDVIASMVAHFAPEHCLQESWQQTRQDGIDEWSNQGFQLASGHCDWWSEFPEDTLDLMTRARVGEDNWLTFSGGEDDAVTITRSDFAGLQPGKFLSDNIIDFYIKYLKSTSLSPENQKRFYFFNSFFFTKLLKNTNDQLMVDYGQLRAWNGEVNLFEKDCVFIPVIQSSHWSLIVIFHLSSLRPSSLDEKRDFPFILHLDPIEGKHERFEGQVRSYILQAWMEEILRSGDAFRKSRASEDMDLLQSVVLMKYIQAEVPHQHNDHDCGLYILHYIEVFLSKSTLPDSSFSLSEAGAYFSGPNFEKDVSDKRIRMRSLIIELGKMSQDEDDNFDIQKPQFQDLPKPSKEIKSKKWKEEETSILLQCMIDGGRFRKGKCGAMHWDLISEEINKSNKNNGLTRSKEQCQNRFDTLKKAYKELNARCVEEGKKFSDVTDEEKHGWKLATPLDEGWFNILGLIDRQRSSLRAKSGQCSKLNLDGDKVVRLPASSPLNSPPRNTVSPTRIGKCASEIPASKQVSHVIKPPLGPKTSSTGSPTAPNAISTGPPAAPISSSTRLPLDFFDTPFAPSSKLLGDFFDSSAAPSAKRVRVDGKHQTTTSVPAVHELFVRTSENGVVQPAKATTASEVASWLFPEGWLGNQVDEFLVKDMDSTIPRDGFWLSLLKSHVIKPPLVPKTSSTGSPTAPNATSTGPPAAPISSSTGKLFRNPWSELLALSHVDSNRSFSFPEPDIPIGSGSYWPWKLLD